MNGHPDDGLFELRLFLEEIVGDLCRFGHVSRDGVAPGSIQVRQEVPVATPGVFADVVIDVPGVTRYIVEVDHGYSPGQLVASVQRKFGPAADWFGSVHRLVLVVDRRNHPDPERLRETVRPLIPAAWALEVWDDEHLRRSVHESFGVAFDSFGPDQLQDVRNAIDQAKGRHAFGDAYANSPLDGALLWHFSHWKLRSLFDAAGKVKRRVLAPGPCQDVAVVFADLSGFSGYVRDTPQDRTIQECLSLFCSRSRHQIMNHGGMVYQFLGDAVIGLFGLPDHAPGYVDEAFDCARSLLTLGEVVSGAWQRRLDRVQPVGGAHIGIALGDLRIFSFRPFSRAHVGAVGDAINLAARLGTHAQSGQIVVSNLVHRYLSSAARDLLQQSEPVEAKNVGRILAWTFDQSRRA